MSDTLTCYGCGYDLAALPEEGVCPECATPIAQSRAANTLELADVEWLHQIHSGLRWLIAAFSMSIVFGLMRLIPSVYLVINWFYYVLMFIHLAVLAVAGIRLTARDPAIVLISRRQPERWARVLILSYVAVMGSWYVWWPIIFARGTLSGFTVATMAWSSLYIAGVALVLVHLRRIAARTTDSRLSVRCGRLIIWFIIAECGEMMVTTPIVQSVRYHVYQVSRWTFAVMGLFVYLSLIRTLIRLRETLTPVIEQASILDAASIMAEAEGEVPPVA